MSNLDNWQETYTIFCSFFSGVGISIHSFHIIIKQSPLALSMPFMWLDCDAMRVYLTNHFHENWRFLLGPFYYKIYTKIAPTGEGFACLRYNKNLAAPRGWSEADTWKKGEHPSPRFVRCKVPIENTWRSEIWQL